MLGVVGIHVGSQYLMNNPTPNLQLLALYEIVTRFSVPIFSLSPLLAYFII